METDQTAPLRTSVPGIGTFKATAADGPPGLYNLPHHSSGASDPQALRSPVSWGLSEAPEPVSTCCIQVLPPGLHGHSTSLRD